jgi:hypothetical protein
MPVVLHAFDNLEGMRLLAGAEEPPVGGIDALSELPDQLPNGDSAEHRCPVLFS